MPPDGIVSLMRTGLASARVCEEGAKALLALTYRSPADCAECVGAGALGALVAALRRHALSSSVCVQATGALANIAFYPQHRGACEGAGVAGALAGAHAAHEAARRYAAIGLEELGYDARGARLPGPEAPHAGMAPARVVRLMARGAAHARGGEEGAKALLALTYRSEALCGEAVGEGAVEALVEVLRAHAAHGEACAQACGALANICFYDTTHHERVRRAGAVPLLVAALRQHREAKRYALVTLEELNLDHNGV